MSCVCESVFMGCEVSILSSVYLLLVSFMGVFLYSSVCVVKFSLKWLNWYGVGFFCIVVVCGGFWWCSIVWMCVSSFWGMNGLFRQLFVLSLSLSMWLMLLVCVVSMMMGIVLLFVCSCLSVVRLFMFGIMRFSMMMVGCLCFSCCVRFVVLCRMENLMLCCWKNLCSRLCSFVLLLMSRICGVELGMEGGCILGIQGGVRMK